MNAKKMSTKEIVNKLNKMTDVPVEIIEAMAREDLVIHLTDLLNGDTDAPDFYNAVMGELGTPVDENYVPGATLTDEEIEAIKANMDVVDDELDSPNSMSQNEAASARTIAPDVTDEILPEDCIAKADAPVTNRVKFEDPKLRKAYRTKCRSIANKLNVVWEQTEAGDYIIDGKLYTFADFVVNHNK